MHNELKFSRDALGITTYLGLSWDRMLALMRKFTYFMMLTAFGGALMQEDIGVKFLLLVQEGQQELIQWVESSMKTAETAHNIRLPLVVKEVMEVEEDLDIICSAFSEQANFVLDITWYGNEVAKKITKELEVPYVKFDLSVSPILKFLDEFLFYRNATDAVIVFDNEKFIEQSLYYWLDTPLLRLATYGAESFTSGKIQKLRPVPQNVAIVAHTTEMEILVKAAIKEHAVTLPDRWILVFMDFNYTNFDKNLLNDSNITFLTINSDVCCLLKGNYDSCDCFGDYNVQENFGKYFANFLAKILIDIKSKKVGVFSNVVCNSTSVDGRNIGFFYTFLEKAIESDNLVIYNSSAAIRMKLNGTIIIGNEEVAKYSSENGVNAEPEKIKPIKKFYRIGTTHALPWSFQLKNETTGELYWTGYCIDLLQKLSEAMNFDYIIVTPKNGTFGEKINGIWDGIVGDLARGEIDLAFTAMVMTADKEEVIDFIPPYFEQSGISIVMRKPVRKTSLFKFMTVLKLEVWLSIVGALTSTGFLLWFLDKYSPYSGRNNKEAYPYSCREFTLKESFWFALTSFTPQGGGEAPKCLSGRTLVAGYWLFVVLMLATFTANLAAFLTVERMQTPVQSLEQLGRQSRINYTVVEGSETHKYFINMKFAEDTLYRMWKELTLNASIDDHRYRVWDYPIREQYGRILMAINDSMPVKDAEEGFRKVNEHEDADFAFIHDSSEIKYEVSRNCNLTEVGEVFAERPYAIAVQQGSRFQDDFSRNIIFLQRDRFFEFLQMKYWNHSNCRSDDSEGITLESLGGVFIATLFGLGLAMITLAFEVVYYKRKDAKAPKIKKVQPIKEISFITQPVTIGTDFKPVEKNMERMSHITLYPRARHRLNQPLPSVNN